MNSSFPFPSKVFWVSKLRDAADQSQAGELWCLVARQQERKSRSSKAFGGCCWVGVVSAFSPRSRSRLSQHHLFFFSPLVSVGSMKKTLTLSSDCCREQTLNMMKTEYVLYIWRTNSHHCLVVFSLQSVFWVLKLIVWPKNRLKIQGNSRSTYFIQGLSSIIYSLQQIKIAQLSWRWFNL